MGGGGVGRGGREGGGGVGMMAWVVVGQGWWGGW